jgi:hypothetical protein
MHLQRIRGDCGFVPGLPTQGARFLKVFGTAGIASTISPGCGNIQGLIAFAATAISLHAT